MKCANVANTGTQFESLPSKRRMVRATPRRAEHPGRKATQSSPALPVLASVVRVLTAPYRRTRRIRVRSQFYVAVRDRLFNIRGYPAGRAFLHPQPEDAGYSGRLRVPDLGG